MEGLGELAFVATNVLANRVLAADFSLDALFVRVGQERGQNEAVFKNA